MKSKLLKQEVSAARVGPRELKDPRSREYAIQTLYALKRYTESKQIDVQRIEEELQTVERYRHWEVLGYSSKQEMLEAEGLADKIADITERAKEAAANAGTIMKLDEAGKIGGRGNKARTNSAGFSVRSTNTTYLAARIKRDRPDIAERIQAGEFRSIHAAAIAAGIAKPTITIRPTVEGFTKAIKKRLTPEQIKELVQNLSGA
jgi:hypothetical protein